VFVSILEIIDNANMPTSNMFQEKFDNFQHDKLIVGREKIECFKDWNKFVPSV
jgi:hypothetical protein